MHPSQFISSLEDLRMDIEKVAAKLASLGGIAIASEQAKYSALALAAASSAVARDAALIVIALENSTVGSCGISRVETD